MLVLVEHIIKLIEQASAFWVFFDFGFVQFAAVDCFVPALCAEWLLGQFVSDFGKDRREVFLVEGFG